jgi:hypothetical protein
VTTRREFLKLGGVAAGAVLLGVPVLAEAPVVAAPVVGMGPVSLNELNHLTKVHILPGIADNFFRSSPLLSAMKKKSYRGGRPFELP